MIADLRSQALGEGAIVKAVGVFRSQDNTSQRFQRLAFCSLIIVLRLVLEIVCDPKNGLGSPEKRFQSVSRFLLM